jgi:hypothetical protein
MTKKTNIAVVGLLLVSVLGVGAVSAHYGGWGQAVDVYCTDDQTVGECRESLGSARQQAVLERCGEKYDDTFCQELVDLKIEQKNETQTLFDENGYEIGTRMEKPDKVKPRDVCTDDSTVGECREAVKTATKDARFNACAETFDAEFCQQLIDLKEEHKEETQALFDEYGYEKPDQKSRAWHKEGREHPGRGHAYGLDDDGQQGRGHGEGDRRQGDRDDDDVDDQEEDQDSD